MEPKYVLTSTDIFLLNEMKICIGGFSNLTIEL